MKDYILKKDLPTFKAGDKFELRPSGLFMVDEDAPVKLTLAYTRSTLEKFPNILTEWFEEVSEGPKTVWDLKDGEEYYQITQTGRINTEVWDGMYYDRDSREAGNVFLTQEEAQKELARRKAKQVLLRDAKGFKQSIDVDHYFIYYNYNSRELRVGYHRGINLYSHLAFASQEDAEASIKAHEKEWKTYLGVSDE